MNFTTSVGTVLTSGALDKKGTGLVLTCKTENIFLHKASDRMKLLKLLFSAPRLPVELFYRPIAEGGFTELQEAEDVKAKFSLRVNWCTTIGKAEITPLAMKQDGTVPQKLWQLRRLGLKKAGIWPSGQ